MGVNEVVAKYMKEHIKMNIQLLSGCMDHCKVLLFAIIANIINNTNITNIIAKTIPIKLPTMTITVPITCHFLVSLLHIIGPLQQ